jgi:hypothetical protein
MATPTPPPQAYTREVVSQAFEWLHQQPTTVREAASSIDAMVAMYLQAKRRSASMGLGPDAASAQTFKRDLRTLAEDLKKFETPRSDGTATSMTPAAAPANPPAMAASHATPGGVEMSLDPKTFRVLEHVRDTLNLSSDSEALRMLVALGFERVRDILPKS